MISNSKSVFSWPQLNTHHEYLYLPFLLAFFFFKKVGFGVFCFPSHLGVKIILSHSGIKQPWELLEIGHLEQGPNVTSSFWLGCFRWRHEPVIYNSLGTYQLSTYYKQDVIEVWEMHLEQTDKPLPSWRIRSRWGKEVVRKWIAQVSL